MASDTIHYGYYKQENSLKKIWDTEESINENNSFRNVLLQRCKSKKGFKTQKFSCKPSYCNKLCKCSGCFNQEINSLNSSQSSSSSSSDDEICENNHDSDDQALWWICNSFAHAKKLYFLVLILCSNHSKILII